MLSRSVLITLTTALAVLVGVLWSCFPDSALSRAELGARDYVARNGRRVSANPKLIFLAIDSDSISLDETDSQEFFKDATPLERRALTLMSKHWPWPRSVYALILDRLVAAGAKVVVFDLNFPTPSEDDALFREALERHADRVVIGSNFTTPEADERDRLNVALTLPASELILQTNAVDSRVGYVNFWPDSDGVIRRAQFHANFGQFLGATAGLGETDHVSLAAQAIRKFGRPELVPTDNGSHDFRYTAEPRQGFPPHSIFEIFAPDYWKQNFASGSVFEGAIVVVGAAGNWQHDEHVTPFGSMAGPEIQLNVMNALLNGEFLKEVPGVGRLAVYFAVGLIAVFGNVFCMRPLHRIALLGALGGAWLAAQIPLFDRFGLLAPMVGPLGVVATSSLFIIVYDLVRAGAEQIRLRIAIHDRKRAQELLEAANAQLEKRVDERTADLTRANELLTDSLEEKSVLLKEVHHRVKNNLQVISSLLNLQSGYIEDPVALQIFNESRNRVRSMALIHEKLYQSEDLARIDFEDYIKAVSSGLVASFGGKHSNVRISVDVDKVMLPVDSAVPCGLIVNELVTNCFKYAFANVEAGEVRIAMKRTNGASLRLSVSDNGIGFPKGVDFRNTESLGMQLVTTLAEQLDGTIDLRNGCGTTFEITFPEANHPKS